MLQIGEIRPRTGSVIKLKKGVEDLVPIQHFRGVMESYRNIVSDFAAKLDIICEKGPWNDNKEKKYKFLYESIGNGMMHYPTEHRRFIKSDAGARGLSATAFMPKEPISEEEYSKMKPDVLLEYLSKDTRTLIHYSKALTGYQKFWTILRLEAIAGSSMIIAREYRWMKRCSHNIALNNSKL